VTKETKLHIADLSPHEIVHLSLAAAHLPPESREQLISAVRPEKHMNALLLDLLGPKQMKYLDTLWNDDHLNTFKYYAFCRPQNRECASILALNCAGDIYTVKAIKEDCFCVFSESQAGSRSSIIIRKWSIGTEDQSAELLTGLLGDKEVRFMQEYIQGGHGSFLCVAKCKKNDCNIAGMVVRSGQEHYDIQLLPEGCGYLIDTERGTTTCIGPGIASAKRKKPKPRGFKS
jgi:hypothetical protein